ncbi:TraR/DksA C4-type zinc finger protein [Couchioplanes caeruleus]|uniref:TraR/DksA family transcriptional regulator n=1 Tax=Couchioplanes caeruleus TaxID=56438 RepID=UPI00209A7B50|nr:TraR/DksA C4-type zinc finger protein [Couchioplanes caeruleus]UQU62703.1 TraR/DksA C4-type zinc finger protein [Couchioplanes caeruleus]
MTSTLHRPAPLSPEPMELLRSMLEEDFAVQTARLTQLTVYARMPGHGGYDAHALELLTAAARQRIADTAAALRRMAEGTYGVCGACERPIPLGRLRSVPSASLCGACEQSS